MNKLLKIFLTHFGATEVNLVLKNHIHEIEEKNKMCEAIFYFILSTNTVDYIVRIIPVLIK